VIDRRGQNLAEEDDRFIFRLDSENPVTLRAKNFAAINRYVAISTLEKTSG
jgi:hypothetical protein